jgi:hypothetical protein
LCHRLKNSIKTTSEPGFKKLIVCLVSKIQLVTDNV